MLIALSGGADSVALLLMMLEKGQAEAAAHCNFHLRGAESDRDEAFVRQLCEERGVRLFVAHFDTEAEAARCGESIEMAARRLRYAWFGRLCREHGFAAVATAHHRDDNAETLLLNLVRGSGLHGLTGMEAERAGVVRPLLEMSRREILDYLDKRGQGYVTDSTNTDTHYRRNKVRHEVLPLLREMNPQIERTLHETARRLAEAEQIYRYGLERLKADVAAPLPNGGGLRIDAGRLQSAPAVATLLYEVLAPYGFTPIQSNEACSMRTGALLEAGDWLLTRTAEALLVQRRPQRVAPVCLPADGGAAVEVGGLRLDVRLVRRDAAFRIPKEPNRVALDADCLRGGLHVRSVAQADRFAPLGMRGTQLVSDYLTNRHRSRIEKLAALVVADADGIVWLVNERPDSRVAVTERTTRVLILHTEFL